MHIAVGITLRDRDDHKPFKIESVNASGGVLLYCEELNLHQDVTAKQVREQFEEFGPNYGHSDDPEDFLFLDRCPFCGSTHLGEENWSAKEYELSNTGPSCNDCGVTAPSVEAWNKRYTPPPVATLWYDGKSSNFRVNWPALKPMVAGKYHVYYVSSEAFAL